MTIGVASVTTINTHHIIIPIVWFSKFGPRKKHRITIRHDAPKQNRRGYVFFMVRQLLRLINFSSVTKNTQYQQKRPLIMIISSPKPSRSSPSTFENSPYFSYHERVRKKHDTVYDLVCMVLINLLYLAKDLAKKMNTTMVESLAAPLAAWLLRLRRNPRQTMFSMG